MPRGRPPKPTTIAFLSGDPGRRRRYQTEPAPPDAPPVAPDFLDAIAKAEWDHTTAILKEMGLLSKADQSALACYCEAWSRYRNAVEQLNKFGAVILSPNKKYPMPSPWHSIMKSALKDIIAFSDRFGLTPSARARLAIEAKDTKADDKWSRLVG